MCIDHATTFTLVQTYFRVYFNLALLFLFCVYMCSTICYDDDHDDGDDATMMIMIKLKCKF